MTLAQNQYWSELSYAHARTWVFHLMHGGLRSHDTDAILRSAVREQLIGAYHSAQARKALEIENALRAIEICLRG